jgi:TolB-like protein
MKAADVKTIGRELSVRYVLRAAFSAAEPNGRSMCLIDAETGNHPGPAFDKPWPIHMQDEIIARLANALNAQLATANPSGQPGSTPRVSYRP